MISLRKSSHVMALFACSMVWGHTRRAEAQPLQMRLAQAADAQRPIVKKHPPELAAALQLYEQLEYEAALEQLAHAKSVAVDTEVRVLTWLYEGIILANLGQMDRSREAFRSGLRLQPSSVLPIEVSPKIAQLFQDVCQQEQPETSSPGPRSPAPPEPVALKASQPPSPESPAPPLVAEAAVTPPSVPLPLPERAMVTPKPSPAEAEISHKEVAPWMPQAPPPPDKNHSVNPYHVVFGVGTAMAISGVTLYAALGRSNPEAHTNLKFAAAVSGLWGLGLVAFGGVGAWEKPAPQPVGSLQSRRVLASTR